MNTKSLINGLALTGALLASASVAKANAYLEMISGGGTLTINTSGSTAATGGASSLFGSETGNSAELVGSVGGWLVDTAVGGALGNLTVQMSDQSLAFGSAGTLTVIYSSGPYPLSGKYLFGGSESGSQTGVTVNGYYSSAQYTGVGLPSAGATSLTGNGTTGFILPAIVPASDSNKLSLSGSYYITEELTFAAPTSAGGLVNGSASFRSYVPDSAETLTILGSALMGMALLRNKLGVKRA